MKKLLIIITLFVSSFFLFSLENVKAYEYNVELDFSLMEDTLSLKEKLDVFIETDTTYSDYYFIYSDNGTIKYYIFLLDSSLDNLKMIVNNYAFGINYSGSLKFGSYLSSISFNSGISNATLWMYNSNNTSTILYFNFNIEYAVSGHTVTYNYDDFSYTETFVVGNKLSNLYDVYLKYQEHLGNKELIHKEEIEKLGSFYTIVIEKLDYLVETIASNYIYLSIIVIFILIFVFLLIFRRFLC